jgi:hypothetical protein
MSESIEGSKQYNETIQFDNMHGLACECMTGNNGRDLDCCKLISYEK